MKEKGSWGTEWEGLLGKKNRIQGRGLVVEEEKLYRATAKDREG